MLKFQKYWFRAHLSHLAYNKNFSYILVSCKTIHRTFLGQRISINRTPPVDASQSCWINFSLTWHYSIFLIFFGKLLPSDFYAIRVITEAVTGGVLKKKVFLKISQAAPATLSKKDSASEPVISEFLVKPFIQPAFPWSRSTMTSFWCLYC